MRFLSAEPAQVTHRFHDGAYSFWTAYYGSRYNDARVVFRVRDGRIPRERAVEKGIRGWDQILPAFLFEIDEWLKGHEDYPLLGEEAL